MVFTDWVIATLVILRFQLPHAAFALFYGADHSTITRAVHEIRPLLAARGFAVSGEEGLRLHTLSDVFAYAAAKGVELRLDGIGVRVRQVGVRLRQDAAEHEHQEGLGVWLRAVVVIGRDLRIMLNVRFFYIWVLTT
ncbi:hypothetical protein ACFVRH_38970, partial [Streptomyces sp. NPDC057909]